MPADSVIDTSRLGRKRATRSAPKGRQVHAQALENVRVLLGDAPRRRDLLIEYLHQIQDHMRTDRQSVIPNPSQDDPPF